AGADITLSGSLDGAHALTLTAGNAGNFNIHAASLSFDGVDDYVDAGSFTSIDGASTASIGFWGYRSSSSYKNDVGKRAGALNDAFILNVWNDGNIYFNVGTWGTVSYTGTGWHYYAMVFDGTQSGDSNRLKGYVDGVQQSLSFGVGAIPATLGNGGNFNIGRDPYLALHSLGSIADVQVYNRALNATEVGQIQAAPVSVTSGLVGFWPLMGGSTEADRSGQGNTGTLVNGPIISSASPNTAILTAGYGTPLTSLIAVGHAIMING